VYNYLKIPGTILSIMCYMPPSVELLGPTTPSFQTKLTPLKRRWIWLW